MFGNKQAKKRWMPVLSFEQAGHFKTKLIFQLHFQVVEVGIPLVSLQQLLESVRLCKRLFSEFQSDREQLFNNTGVDAMVDSIPSKLQFSLMASRLLLLSNPSAMNCEHMKFEPRPAIALLHCSCTAKPRKSGWSVTSQPVGTKS